MATIIHDKNKKQFSTTIEGKKATLDYTVTDNEEVLNYKSTFVPPELRGQHIGQDLVAFALEYAKMNHLKIIPSCPFIKSYINHHPEYQSIMA